MKASKGTVAKRSTYPFYYNNVVRRCNAYLNMNVPCAAGRFTQEFGWLLQHLCSCRFVLYQDITQEVGVDDRPNPTSIIIQWFRCS